MNVKFVCDIDRGIVEIHSLDIDHTIIVRDVPGTELALIGFRDRRTEATRAMLAAGHTLDAIEAQLAIQEAAIEAMIQAKQHARSAETVIPHAREMTGQPLH